MNFKDLLKKILIGLIAISESAQIVIVGAWLSLLFPPTTTLEVYSEFIDTLHPERDMFFFRLFVLLSVGFMILMDYGISKKKLNYLELNLPWCLCISLSSFIFLATGYVKNIISPLIWTKEFLGCLIIVVWILKSILLFQRGKDCFEKIINWLSQTKGIRIDFGLILLVLSVIFVKDTQAILAYSFLYDNNLHFDTAIMSPALVHYLGGVINVDLFSFYGVGLPVFLANLAKSVGGLSYELWLNVYLGCHYIFFVTLFIFLRIFLQSRLWAALGTLTGIFFQLFHAAIAPMPLIFPSASILRYFYLIFVALCILLYLRRQTMIWLWAAAFLTGLSVIHFWDTGLYGLITFFLFLLFIGIEKYQKKGRQIFTDLRTGLFIFLTPLMIAGALLFWIARGYFFQKIYWQNSFEQVHMTLNGWLSNLLIEQLRQGQWLSYLGSFIIPIIYVFVLAHLMIDLIHRKLSKQGSLIAFICIYGLFLFHYFMLHSVSTAYLSSSIPGVIISIWLLQKLFQSQGKNFRNCGAIVAVAILASLFMFNESFVRYPNIYSIKPFDWKEIKERYRRESDFEKDVSLIKALIPPEKKAALITSFDLKLCLEAGRLPYFYYVPLFRSSLFSTNEFKGTFAFTKNMMAKIIGPLKTQPPEYIFIEKRIYQGQLRPEVYAYSYSLVEILREVIAHYDFYREGQYLIALKRKH